MLKGKNFSGTRLSLRDVKFLLLPQKCFCFICIHSSGYGSHKTCSRLQLTADYLGRVRVSFPVTAVISCSTSQVLMLRLFGLGVCGPRRGKASSSRTLLLCKRFQAQLLCLCPKPLLVIMGPYGKRAQGAG